MEQSNAYNLIAFYIREIIRFQASVKQKNTPATSAFPKGSSLKGSSRKYEILI